MAQHRRPIRRHPAGAMLLAGLLCIAAATPASASTPITDPRWLPWIGCWTPTTATTDVAATLSAAQRVCIVPADGAEGVDVVGVADGQVVSRVRVSTTGERSAVSRGGCEGWETARWSAGGGRVFLRSEMTCAGGLQRVSSGIIAIASPGDWVDVEVVRVRDQQTTRVVRYRSAADSTALDREIATAMTNRELARRTARMGAAALPTIADVIEASREVEPAVVEAWLLQRMPRFAVDARQLRQLAHARVPGTVIDLVVALSSPEQFHDRLATRGYTLVRVGVPRQAVVALEPETSPSELAAPRISVQGGTYEDRSYGDRCDRCRQPDVNIYYDPTPSAPYGYNPYWPYGPYYPSYPYGQYYPSYPYDPYYPSYPNNPRPHPDPQTPPRPPVIVNGPRYPKPAPTRPAPEPEVNGKAINGRGYTRPGNSSAPEPATAPPQQQESTPVTAEPRYPAPASQSQPQPRPQEPRYEPPRSQPPAEQPRQAQPAPEQPRYAQPRTAPPPAPTPEPRESKPEVREPKPAPAPVAPPPPAPTTTETKPDAPARTAKVRPPTGG